MAVTNNNNNNNNKNISTSIYKNIDELVDAYKSNMSKANKALIAEEQKLRAAAQQKIIDVEQTLEEELTEEIAKFREQKLLNSDKEVYRYARKVQLENELDKYKYRLKLEKELTKKAEKQREKELEFYKKLASLRSSVDENGNEKTSGQKAKDTIKADFMENMAGLKQGFTDSMKNLGTNFMQAVSQMSNVINSTISTYANYRGTINARLQGSIYDKNDKSFQILSDSLDKIAFSGLLSASDLYSNLEALVKEGIGTNVAQRALFQTIKKTIADTFDVNAASLKRLIRIQQEDSTAARLGMEAYLTKFLNEFTASTEYLTTTFDTVADNLLEASAMLKSTSGAAEFEYVVQKWLGSLTGLGLSESSASSIAQAIGYLGSGNIESLSGSAINNLLVMAASKANLSYADLLTQGLDAVDANKLLLGMTEYLQDIAKSSSNVVKSQLAKTFGVSVSDLVAIQNVTNLKGLYENVLSAGGMYSELQNQLSLMTNRMGTAKILENLFNNFQYSTGMNIANSPALYAMWKITDMIQGVTGGINIPAISVMGNMVDLNTTVENLMKLGIIGASTLGGIGNIISGISSTFNGTNLLKALEISSGISAVERGGKGLQGSKNVQKITTSSVSYIGNTAGTDYSENARITEEEKYKQEVPEKSDILEYYETMKLDEKIRSIDMNVKSIVDNGIVVRINSGTIPGLT